MEEVRVWRLLETRGNLGFGVGRFWFSYPKEFRDRGLGWRNL